MTDSLGSADSLWLQREPSAEEVIEMLQGWELSQYDELVFAVTASRRFVLRIC